MRKYPSQLRSKLEFKLESNLSFAKHRKLSSECLVLRSVEYDVEWYINVDKFLVGQGLSTWLAESVIINKLSTFINQGGAELQKHLIFPTNLSLGLQKFPTFSGKRVL